MIDGGRNSFGDELFIFKAVEDFSVFDGFSCGDEDLDDFIHNDALPQQELLLSKTYRFSLKLQEGGESPPVAFASLANDSVKLDTIRKQQVALIRIPYRDFPAVKICRLGVSAEFQGQGVGTYLVNVIKTLFLSKNRTGCRFITVDAYNCDEQLNFITKKMILCFLRAEI